MKSLKLYKQLLMQLNTLFLICNCKISVITIYNQYIHEYACPVYYIVSHKNQRKDARIIFFNGYEGAARQVFCQVCIISSARLPMSTNPSSQNTHKPFLFERCFRSPDQHHYLNLKYYIPSLKNILSSIEYVNYVSCSYKGHVIIHVSHGTINS